MPLLLHAASFVIAAVFSVSAAATIFTVPSVSNLVLPSCFPIMYDNTVFLLKPPYLYLVINCIIVSIVATSKLTRKSSSVDDYDFSEVVIPALVSEIDTGYLNVVHVASDSTGFVEKSDIRDEQENVREFPEVIADDNKLKLDDGEDLQSSDLPEPETEKPKPKDDSMEIPSLKQTRKPPSFSQQKTLKPSPQGGYKKTALGVTKPPKRPESLETTWKKITEGRSTPLTKHLKKSDTWQETSSHVRSSPSEKMTKSENIGETQKTRLKREPSLGQEELNRRVEEFIKKFNEEMRLQRLESLAKYNGATTL